MKNRNRREKTKRDAVQLLEELLRNKEREVHTIASAKLNKSLADLIRSVVKMENIMNIMKFTMSRLQLIERHLIGEKKVHSVLVIEYYAFLT